MKDIISASALMILSVYVFVTAGDIVSKTNMDIGPDFMPRLIAVLIFGLSALMLFGAVRTHTSTDSALPPQASGGFVYDHADWLSIGLIICYGLAFSALGYVIATAIYIVLQGLLIARPGERKLVPILIAAVIVPILSNYLFVNILHVFLPTGILG